MFSLLTLLDDIATTLDDVAVMSKIALKKTSAIMSDDLAVNAGVVTGANPDRELPIVKSIFFGSLLNKIYAIAGVLVLMAIYPPALKGILLVGGLYLCFEGAHKIYEKLFHKNHDSKVERKELSESDKIKGAIRTDLVLSIEIIVIANEAVTGGLLNQALVLSAVGLAASIIIYGLVALLVKIDDLGLILIKKNYKKVGLIMVQSMPYTMKGLGIIGTLAMLLVGGGIISHTFHLANYLPELIQNMLLGLLAGALLVVPFELYQKQKN